MQPQPGQLEDLVAQVRALQPEGTSLERLSDAVRTAARLGELADKLIEHFVDEARRSGASWTDGRSICRGRNRGKRQKRTASSKDVFRGDLCVTYSETGLSDFSNRPIFIGRDDRIRTCDPLTPIHELVALPEIGRKPLHVANPRTGR